MVFATARRSCSCNTFFGAFVTCNPSFLATFLQSNQSLTKISQLYFPPPKKLRSLHASLHTYTISYPITLKKQQQYHHAKQKQKQLFQQIGANVPSIHRPVTPLILPPGIQGVQSVTGGPTDWWRGIFFLQGRGISCCEIVSLCRSYPCGRGCFAKNYRDAWYLKNQWKLGL